MDRVPVKSSACSAVGYDALSQTLEVQYHPKNGEAHIWQYAPIDVDVYARMISGTESVGRIVAAVKARVTAGDVVSVSAGSITIDETAE